MHILPQGNKIFIFPIIKGTSEISIISYLQTGHIWISYLFIIRADLARDRRSKDVHEGRENRENRQIWAETTFKVGNAAVGATSLTTFRHCFPCERQTGLIASTSDLFRLAVCNWLLLRIVPGPAMQPLVVDNMASHKTTCRTFSRFCDCHRGLLSRR